MRASLWHAQPGSRGFYDDWDRPSDLQQRQIFTSFLVNQSSAVPREPIF